MICMAPSLRNTFSTWRAPVPRNCKPKPHSSKPSVKRASPPSSATHFTSRSKFGTQRRPAKPTQKQSARSCWMTTWQRHKTCPLIVSDSKEIPKLRMAPVETAEQLAHRAERERRAVELQREGKLEQSLEPFRVGSVSYLNAAP